MNQTVIYLASASPRRRQLLDQIGVDYEVCPVDVDESRQHQEIPKDYVARVSLLKSTTARDRLALSDQIVLGADTTVAVDDTVLGKPQDRAQGLAMMEALSGRVHYVFTGVSVVRGDWWRSIVSVTRVTMRGTTASERAAYWNDGEPRDKAGAYGVQGLGSVFVERIEGSYSGVMGLPLCDTARLLQQAGLQIFAEK